MAKNKREGKKKKEEIIESVTSMSTSFGIKQTWVLFYFQTEDLYVGKPLKIPDSQFTHVGRSSPNSWKG